METIHDIVFFPGIEKCLSTFENDLAQEQKQTQECVKIALKILGSFKFFVSYFSTLASICALCNS